MRLLPFALFLAAMPAAAQDAAPAAVDPLQDCSAHKFETTVERIVDGEPRHSRVKLCGQKGQSDGDWIVTLEDAIAKLRANAEVPAESRTQIIAAIEREILRLRDPAAAAAAQAPALTPRAPPKPRDFRNDYANLPALPPPVTAAPVPPPPATLSEPGAVQVTPSSDVVIAPASRPARSAPAKPATTAVAAASAPLLAFDCYVPGDIAGPAPCTGFERETLITVRARSDVGANAELHFERNGSDRAKVAIGPLKKGRSVRLPLPREVCSGVGDGRLAIVVWNGGSPGRTEGPYSLRCS